MMKKISYLYICFTLFQAIQNICPAQKKITFESSDGLLITADLYKTDDEYPYVLLFHQAGYSRGEYKDIAKKICMIGFNCIAVDLRSGKEVNFIKNETFLLAKQQNLPTEYPDSEKDILSSIEYAFNLNQKEVILFGSSYSASLCLRIAKDNPKVKAVVAFSPGEFFKPDLIQNQLMELKKPLFAASSQREYPYMMELLSNVPENNKTLFKPQNEQGEHGAKSLWEESAGNSEYWFALLIFLKQFKG